MVTVFTPYAFEIGEKIYITEGRRKGDWEVIDCDDAQVTLRCPVSGKEVVWARFAYHVEKREQQWPQED